MSAAKKTSQNPQDPLPVEIEFLSPFIAATVNTMRIQAGLKVENGEPLHKNPEPQSVDILGVISLVSRVYEGSISLCFPKTTFVKLYNRLFNENHSAISPENEDAAGELLNMIFGAAKAQLNNQLNYQIPRALPAVVSGQKLKLTRSLENSIILPFNSEIGSFHLELKLTRKSR